MRLEPIPRDLVPPYWPRIAPWLKQLDERFPAWARMQDPMGKCMTGHAQLWLIRDGQVIKGALITQITVDAERVAEIPVAVGEDMEDCLYVLDELEPWARREGCVALVSTAGREGWIRVLKDRGWRKTAVLMERRL
jgi:hypothetical protein